MIRSTSPATGIEFRDNIYSNETAETVMAKDIINDVTGNPDPDGELFVSWSTTIAVQDAATDPISGATVAIDDVTPTEVFSGTTNGSGLAVAVLTEFDTVG